MLRLDDIDRWAVSQVAQLVATLTLIGWVASHGLTVSWAWDAPAARAAQAPSSSSAALVVPVRGVDAADLRDTFDDARAGGTRQHHAIDIHAPLGTPVLAAAEGVVARVHDGSGGGKSIYQLSQDSTRVYYYAHLVRYAAGLAPGTSVDAGDVIGYVGDTGNAPPGVYHLHFAIWTVNDPNSVWRGNPINPYPLLTAS